MGGRVGIEVGMLGVKNVCTPMTLGLVRLCLKLKVA